MRPRARFSASAVLPVHILETLMQLTVEASLKAGWRIPRLVGAGTRIQACIPMDEAKPIVQVYAALLAA